jgi:hypothetical protein
MRVRDRFNRRILRHLGRPVARGFRLQYANVAKRGNF